MSEQREKMTPAEGNYELTSTKSFPYSVNQLQNLIENKDFNALSEMGGTLGLINGLKVNSSYGLSLDDRDLEGDANKASLETRKAVYGENRLPPVKSKSFLRLVFEALQDKIMILLSIAALVSLAIGIYEDLTEKQEDKPTYTNTNGETVIIDKPHWIEGVAILVAVVIVVLVQSINDFRKEKQFQKLNSKKEDRMIKVLRDGKSSVISVYDLVVGDIVLLEPGDILPVDGILIFGHNLACDESSATGESDAIKKRPLEDIAIPSQTEQPISYHKASGSALPNLSIIQGSGNTRPKSEPFLLSGSKVLEGVGNCVVVNVGPNSFNGKIMMNLRTENVETPLQIKLSALADRISKLGGAAALLMLVVLIIKYFANWSSQDQRPAIVLNRIVSIIITTITVVVVAVPEGLPLAVTLALAFATVRMLKDNNLVRLLSACETMGSATTVCSDKTGTLTTNRMTVVAGTFGTTVQFLKDPSSLKSVNTASPPLSIDKLHEALPKKALEVLSDGIAINSSAFEGKDDKGNVTLIGSKTEVALLEWVEKLTSYKFDELRHKYPVEQLWPFSSERKSMSTLVKLNEETYRLFVKGASEIILGRCSDVIEFSSDNQDSFSTLTVNKDLNMAIQHRISEYAQDSLRTIGLAFKDYNLGLEEIKRLSGLDSDMKQEFWEQKVGGEELTFLGVVGIEDPLRDGVPEAVAACARAGVVVRMVTGDNVLTAKSIASKCGIYTEGSIIMEGPEFRKLTKEQLDYILPRLRVLARSSPEDKMKLVQHLRSLDEVVAVTGDGTNDAPALKAADIGFSMGIAGTEVAKEASSIILMDDNFSSIVKAIMWGRTVNDAIKKFLQFQLTVNVTAVVVTFISAALNEKESSVLKAVQLLWVNLIMDTLAALALATDPPSEEVLNRPPDSRKSNLVSPQMWKMILGQAAFQIAVTFAILYGGLNFYKANVDDKIEDSILATVVFNAFVFLQIFNLINCRRVDSKLNIFAGIHKNPFFLVIIIGVVFLQVIIVQFGGSAFETVPLDGPQWAASLLVGVLSVPIGLALRLVPTNLFDALGGHHHHNLPEKSLIHNSATTQSPTPMNRIGNQEKPFLSAAMLPSMVATSVGVGLTPHNSAPVEQWLNKDTSTPRQ